MFNYTQKHWDYVSGGLLQNQEIQGFLMELAKLEVDGSQMEMHMTATERSFCYQLDLIFDFGGPYLELELMAELPQDKVAG